MLTPELLCGSPNVPISGFVLGPSDKGVTSSSGVATCSFIPYGEGDKGDGSFTFSRLRPST